MAAEFYLVVLPVDSDDIPPMDEWYDTSRYQEAQDEAIMGTLTGRGPMEIIEIHLIRRGSVHIEYKEFDDDSKR